METLTFLKAFNFLGYTLDATEADATFSKILLYSPHHLVISTPISQ